MSICIKISEKDGGDKLPSSIFASLSTYPAALLSKPFLTISYKPGTVSLQDISKILNVVGDIVERDPSIICIKSDNKLDCALKLTISSFKDLLEEIQT